MQAEQPLWVLSPELREHSPMAEFIAWCSERFGRTFTDYDAFHAWSVAERGDFWTAVWEHCNVIGERGATALVNGDRMLDARFFPEAKLNFAENLLRETGDGDALVFRGEDKVDYRLSWNELRALVSRLQQALKAQGIGPGDRVAAMMPNMPETIALMLATASIGAIWSSCSPDFGEQGVLDRFGQIAPKLFIACDGYWYNGKRQDVDAKVRAVSASLAVPALIVPYAGDSAALAASIAGAASLGDFIAPFEAKALTFERLPFSHPLYVLFSSGTTGVPKCIVHSAGGTLLQHLKEHRFHCGLRRGEKLFYFTTCGWMMWNWLASGLAVGATLCLFDGSPFHPGPAALFDLAQQERVDVLGVSAKFLDSVRKAGVRPIDSHDLASVRAILSTGSPLAPEGFDFVYDAVKRDVQLASISGGTDIVSCFVGGDPTSPVWRGECQRPCLGMAVDVYDDEGWPVGPGGAGELGRRGHRGCLAGEDRIDERAAFNRACQRAN